MLLYWFELADKSRDKTNEKGWFEQYLQDDIFVEIISRINTESFKQPDWEYIKDQEQFTEEFKRWGQVYIDEGIEIGFEKGMEKGRQEGIEKGIVAALKRGKLSVNEIAEDFGVPVEYILQLKK